MQTKSKQHLPVISTSRKVQQLTSNTEVNEPVNPGNNTEPSFYLAFYVLFLRMPFVSFTPVFYCSVYLPLFISWMSLTDAHCFLWSSQINVSPVFNLTTWTTRAIPIIFLRDIFLCLAFDIAWHYLSFMVSVCGDNGLHPANRISFEFRVSVIL